MVNIDRLKQLSQLLRTLPPQLWDFNNFVSKVTCGTVGCALGHCPDLWPDTWKVSQHLGRMRLIGPSGDYSREAIAEDAAAWFGLTRYQVFEIFFLANGCVTATVVADRIDALIKD